MQPVCTRLQIAKIAKTSITALNQVNVLISGFFLINDVYFNSKRGSHARSKVRVAKLACVETRKKVFKHQVRMHYGHASN